jgi:hypothetical protein
LKKNVQRKGIASRKKEGNLPFQEKHWYGMSLKFLVIQAGDVSPK